MSYEIKGKIIAILEKRSGVTKSTGNNWFSQSYVLETSDAYPKKLCFEIFGERKPLLRVFMSSLILETGN